MIMGSKDEGVNTSDELTFNAHVDYRQGNQNYASYYTHLRLYGSRCCLEIAPTKCQIYTT